LDALSAVLTDNIGMRVSTVSLAGMNTAQHRVRVVASDLANISAPQQALAEHAPTPTEVPLGDTRPTVWRPQPGSTLEALMVERLAAANTYMVNMAVFQSGYRALGTLLYARG
jgi:hypothetical protein